ncbi:phage tail protein [Photorhabdus caribbeanensis]|uniref:phage tail protein n=1 Tax=Photorhabdus caribbeanensis TaxID=1004165 RepID=UPI001BD3A231|nr:phage tail protein [Photorhabdus caribbeanensis]MBS9422297.1 hypothetical protein [Photorhabdus caribbeanensis]
MAKNEFLTFGIAEGANVLSNEEYAALAARVNGFSAGVAKSRELNKAWRQSSIITHILADFIAKESGKDVLDNGDINALKSNLALAIKNALPEVRDATLSEKGIIQLTDKTGNSNTLAATQKLVTDVNNNANTKLAKNQNGADIPDKNAFVKNLGLVETVNLAKSAVPNSRKINGKALTGDVSLSAGDVGAISTYELGWVGDGGKFQNFLATGFYRVTVSNLSTVSDFPLNLYTYGFLEVRNSFSAISQQYTSHHGEVAIRQSWDSGKTWLGWDIVYSSTTLPEQHPVGAPIPWPLPNVPAGYLACNGQSFNKSLYPKLAEAYPNGRLPDLRGEFIRGWDDSRGVDPGRVCGSWQGDAIQNITGSIIGGSLEPSGAFYKASTVKSYVNYASNYIDLSWIYFDASRVARTANETRPRNIAFNYIVRAA